MAAAFTPGKPTGTPPGGPIAPLFGFHGGEGAVAGGMDIGGGESSMPDTGGSGAGTEGIPPNDTAFAQTFDQPSQFAMDTFLPSAEDQPRQSVDTGQGFSADALPSDAGTQSFPSWLSSVVSPAIEQ